MIKVNKITPDEHTFTQRLTELYRVPKRLWYMGKIPAAAPTVAIVGSRKPTEYGKYVTLKIASQLASRGVIIVSGLALGHDALAARGALDGGGITVAVLGTGLDRIYPASNKPLAEEIVRQGGAIITENEPGATAHRGSFLERNRIVSGLADAVIVVEAAEKSGTLNTAMHALEQGKELFAVPGNITSPLSVGCNRLIAQGSAHPLVSVDDVLEVLDLTAIGETQNLPLSQDPCGAKILECLRGGPADGDVIAAQTGISATEFNTAITLLEISGQAKALGANRWIIK